MVRLWLALWATCSMLQYVLLDPRRRYGLVFESVVKGAMWATALLVAYGLWRWTAA